MVLAVGIVYFVLYYGVSIPIHDQQIAAKALYADYVKTKKMNASAINPMWYTSLYSFRRGEINLIDFGSFNANADVHFGFQLVYLMYAAPMFMNYFIFILLIGMVHLEDSKYLKCLTVDEVESGTTMTYLLNLLDRLYAMSKTWYALLFSRTRSKLSFTRKILKIHISFELYQGTCETFCRL